jgi:hypothetical protein
MMFRQHLMPAKSSPTAALPKGVYSISMLSAEMQFNQTDKSLIYYFKRGCISVPCHLSKVKIA